MGVPPKIKKVVKAVVKSKLPDPGRLFYKVAVRDSIQRGNVAEMKALLKVAKGIQSTGIDNLVNDLETAIKAAK